MVLQQLRAEIESKFAAGRFSWESVLPNDAAGLLKQLIRELPIPLLTFDYLDAFAQIDSTSCNQFTSPNTSARDCRSAVMYN